MGEGDKGWEGKWADKDDKIKRKNKNKNNNKK